MCGNHSPSLRQSHPCLALTPAEDTAILVAFELQVDAAEILAESRYVQTCDPASEVGRWPRGAKSGDLLDAVQVFCRAEPDNMRRRPKETLHRLDVVIHQGGFIFGIKGGKFGDGLWVVDGHS